MEVLAPSPPPHPHSTRFLGAPPVPNSGLDVSPRALASASQLPQVGGAEEDQVFVALGKSLEKGVGLLNWALRRFGGRKIGIVHVHQPSPTIPTLLGKLPASQANEEFVSAYRRKEQEEMIERLLHYCSICYKAKVQASVAMIVAEQVQKGIVDLVVKYGIRKLVMGASPDSCIKVKKSSMKAGYTAKNAPGFCEIWFVYRGKHIWTRDASEGPCSLQILHSLSQKGNHLETLTLKSIPLNCSMQLSSSDHPRFLVSSIDASDTQVSSSMLTSYFTKEIDDMGSESSIGSTNTLSETSSSTEGRLSLESNLKEGKDANVLSKSLNEVVLEAERWKQEVFKETLEYRRLESEAADIINKVKAFEAACAREVEVRRQVEEELKNTVKDQEKVLLQKDESKRELEMIMRNIALQDAQAQEVAHHRNEASRELKLIQVSMRTLLRERKKIRRQKKEAMFLLDQWRNSNSFEAPSYRRCIGFPVKSYELAEFSLSDLQTATCDFSESFKISQGGYGCVYKGEIAGTTVAIKKFHPDYMQCRSEFQQEVQILRKLQHPRLVALLGACFEAWSLVYEYVPNGSLQDCLFCKGSRPPLSWEIRARITSEIASALFFLHSTKPEKIVHGNLKPKNILLDSEFKCKICDFGISRLMPEEITCRRSFRLNVEPKGSFHCADPEFQTGDLTLKSDVYSFGIIVLQLLTGRPPMGLVPVVRRAVSSGNLASLLDPSAGDWPTFLARRLAELGLQCTELNGRDRPELTSAMVRELERLHLVEERPVPPFFLCPILKEIMHDPQVAADGFTYEGDAILRWLRSGCETSPMTNLKLKHLNLTPNFTLRLAIQDWLRQC